MDNPLISLFRSSCLTRESPRSPVWAAPEVGGQVLAKTSCSPRLHYAEWLCVVLNDSPRRHNGSGRDWPDKSRSVDLSAARGTLRRYSQSSMPQAGFVAEWDGKTQRAY